MDSYLHKFRVLMEAWRKVAGWEVEDGWKATVSNQPSAVEVGEC